MISIIFIGIFWVLNGQLKIGQLMAIITISGIVVSSISSLSGANIKLQEAGVAFDRFYEFIKAKPEFIPTDYETYKTEKVEDKNRNINLQIRQLSYRFIGRKKIFDDISIEINSGEIVTLCGEIGSGKSTLIQILQKHYFPEGGDIIFNGKSLSEYSIPLWRQYIGVVSQQIKIFNGSVGDNICLGNYLEERESIFEFCHNYGFNTFFDSFHQGLDTLLGEDGVNISGGQKQLVAIARALYRKPSILLLDEPTSAMDTKTEEFVISLLKQRKSQFATLLVTHRLQLAGISDRIYTLKNGATSCLNKNSINPI